MTALFYIIVGFVTIFSGIAAIIGFTNRIITKNINTKFEEQEKELQKRFDNLEEKLRQTEKNLFRHGIFSFTRRLREGHHPALNEFHNVLHDATFYKNLGGNLYVDEEVLLIKKRLRELHGKEDDNVRKY